MNEQNSYHILIILKIVTKILRVWKYSTLANILTNYSCILNIFMLLEKLVNGNATRTLFLFLISISLEIHQCIPFLS